MTIEEQVLRNMGMTEHDVKKHLKDGVSLYLSFEEFWDACTDCGWSEDDFDSAISTYQKMPSVSIGDVNFRVDFHY